MHRVLIGIALLFVAQPAWAQTPQQSDWCGPAATDDQRLAGCTALIQLGRETPANLAVDYYNRGNAYQGKGLYDQAIADYTQSIALEPNDADAYNNRGNAYHRAGLYDRATPDYTEAIALKPDDFEAHNDRGFNYLANDLYDRAIADFTQATGPQPRHCQSLQGSGLGLHLAGRDARGLPGRPARRVAGPDRCGLSQDAGGDLREARQARRCDRRLPSRAADKSRNAGREGRPRTPQSDAVATGCRALANVRFGSIVLKNSIFVLTLEKSGPWAGSLKEDAGGPCAVGVLPLVSTPAPARRHRTENCAQHGISGE